MTQLYDHLQSIDACQSTLDWLGERTAQQAWDECEYADWLLWWLYKEHPYGSDGYRDAVRAAADCAETAVQYLETDEQRTLAATALAAARMWADEPTTENRHAARRAAASAADAADAAASASAAYAVDAASAAASTAYAADAYASAAYAAASAAGADAKKDAHTKMCALIRARIPQAPWTEG